MQYTDIMQTWLSEPDKYFKMRNYSDPGYYQHYVFKDKSWFAQLQTDKFQGTFKDKLQFSRTVNYSINRHSLTPF